MWWIRHVSWHFSSWECTILKNTTFPVSMLISLTLVLEMVPHTLILMHYKRSIKCRHKKSNFLLFSGPSGNNAVWTYFWKIMDARANSELCSRCFQLLRIVISFLPSSLSSFSAKAAFLREIGKAAFLREIEEIF